MSALEIVGIFALWLVGLAVSFYGPFLLCMLKQGGLEVMALGFAVASYSAGFYVLATIIYFIAT